MKFSEQLFRFLAVTAIVGVIGTIGGLEHHMFGFGRCILQSGFFMLLAIFCHEQAEAAHRATRRRKRKAVK